MRSFSIGCSVSFPLQRLTMITHSFIKWSMMHVIKQHRRIQIQYLAHYPAWKLMKLAEICSDCCKCQCHFMTTSVMNCGQQKKCFLWPVFLGLAIWSAFGFLHVVIPSYSIICLQGQTTPLNWKSCLVCLVVGEVAGAGVWRTSFSVPQILVHHTADSYPHILTPLDTCSPPWGVQLLQMQHNAIVARINASQRCNTADSTKTVQLLHCQCRWRNSGKKALDHCWSVHVLTFARPRQFTPVAPLHKHEESCMPCQAQKPFIHWYDSECFILFSARWFSKAGERLWYTCYVPISTFILYCGMLDARLAQWYITLYIISERNMS